MDVNTIAALIGSVGFPIVCCLLLFWFVNKTLTGLQKSIDGNTRAIDKLMERMDKGEQ